MKKVHYLLFAGALAFAACDSKPAGDEAEVAEATEVQEVTADVTFNVAEDNSKFAWIGLKPGGRHYGTFGLQGGNIQVSDGAIVGGELNIDLNEIEVADLEGDQKKDLTDHLKSPDFFNVAEHPNAKFVITSVEEISGTANAQSLSTESAEEVDDAADQFLPVIENPTHRVTGNLTMRDTTLSVTFPAHVNMTESGLEAKARFVIDRTNWGVSYGDESNVVDKTKDKFIYNNVAVGFDLVANQ